MSWQKPEPALCERKHAPAEHRALDVVLAQYLLNERSPPLLDSGCFAGPPTTFRSDPGPVWRSLAYGPDFSKAFLQWPQQRSLEGHFASKVKSSACSTCEVVHRPKRLRLGIQSAPATFAAACQELVLNGTFDRVSFRE